MQAVIKFNGIELPDSLCIVENGTNKVTIQTPVSRGEEIDMNTHAVEVNIFGELPELLESNWNRLFDETK